MMIKTLGPPPPRARSKLDDDGGDVGSTGSSPLDDALYWIRLSRARRVAPLRPEPEYKDRWVRVIEVPEVLGWTATKKTAFLRAPLAYEGQFMGRTVRLAAVERSDGQGSTVVVGWRILVPFQGGLPPGLRLRNRWWPFGKRHVEDTLGLVANSESDLREWLTPQRRTAIEALHQAGGRVDANGVHQKLGRRPLPESEWPKLWDRGYGFSIAQLRLLVLTAQQLER